MGVSAADIRSVAGPLPRSEEALVRDSVRFRVRQLVYVSISPDETLMGFAFPKEERDALVGGDPEKFVMPETSDLRFNWVRARMVALTFEEMHELVMDAWQMVVPKKVVAEYFGGIDPGRSG